MSCQDTIPIPLTPRLFRSRVLWLHYMLAVVSDDDHFDMQTFVQQRGPQYARFRNEFAAFPGLTSGWPWCSTAGCIGGHIVMLGYTSEERDSPKFRYASFTLLASEWLGLDQSDTSAHLAMSMFSPGYSLEKINRQQAVDVVHNLYDDGVLHWKAVSGLADFDYAGPYIWGMGDRGGPISVAWLPEPDTIIGDLFALRDRIRKSYWNGKSSQPDGASLDNDVPVCLLTGAGAVERDAAHYGHGSEMREALRKATPLDTTFVHVSDSGLDSALALIDKAVLIRLGVIPPLRTD